MKSLLAIQEMLDFSESKDSTALKPSFATQNVSIAVILHGFLSS